MSTAHTLIMAHGTLYHLLTMIGPLSNVVIYLSVRPSVRSMALTQQWCVSGQCLLQITKLVPDRRCDSLGYTLTT